jgi:methyl-accepting chemotaxis protein
MKKIQTKIIIAMVICTILITGIVTIVGLNMSSKTVKMEASSRLETLAKQRAKELDAKFHTTQKEIMGLENSINTLLQDSHYEKLEDIEVRKKLRLNIVKLVEKYAYMMEGNLDTYVQFKPEFVNRDLQVAYFKKDDKYIDMGEVVTYEDLTSKSDETSWFWKPIEENKGVWSKPYDDKYFNEKLITFSYPITLNNQIIGVVGTDIMFNDFEKMIKDVKVYDTGYAFLLSENFEFLVHPKYKSEDNIDLVENGAFKKVKIDISEKMNGISVYEVNNTEKIMGFCKLENGWLLGVSPPVSEIYAGISKIKNYLLLITLFGVILTIFIAVIVGKKISQPIIVASKFASRMATGDLKENIPHKYLKQKDEIGILANSLNILVKEFREIIENIIKSSADVSTSSENLYSVSVQVVKISDGVAVATEEIAKGSTEQAQNTEVGAQKIYEIGNLIENNKELVNNINEKTDYEVRLVNEGLTIIKDLTNKANETENAAKDISKIINQTNEKVNNIGEASNLITSIAEQTNLLALNAAIEAARAGESGKGFAVVAEEIRKLAEQSARSSEKIDDMVKELTQSSILGVNMINRVLEIVKEQVYNVEETKLKYNEISDSIEVSKETIIKLNDSEVQMNDRKTEVMARMQELSAISQQNAAGTQEVSASIEEQTNSVKNIEISSKELSELAEELKLLTLKFKV